MDAGQRNVGHGVVENKHQLGGGHDKQRQTSPPGGRGGRGGQVGDCSR